MKLFLRLKRGQLIGIFIGLSLLAFISKIISVESNSIISSIVVFLIGILNYALIFGWLYSVGINLHKKLPAKIDMNLKRFKTFLAILFVCILLLFSLLLGELSGFLPENIFSTLFGFLMLFILFLMPFYVYCIYFVAKSLTIVELQKYTSDNLIEIILICFFPIGLWFIQPRINKIFTNKNKR